MRLGLRGRIVLLVLVALAPPTIIALGVALEERDEARTHAQGDVLDQTRVVAADVQRVVAATASFLSAVSKDLANQGGDGYCERLLAIVPRATEWYSSVGVAGADGRVYCGTTAEGFARPMRPVDVAGASWFREARRQGGFVLGDLGMGPLGSTEVLITAHPVAGRKGARPSVLFAGLDIQRLAGFTALSDPPRDTTFVVLDHHGTVVASVPQADELIGHRLPDRPLVETVLRERQGTAEVKGLDGVEQIHAFAPVGGKAGDSLFITAGRSSESIFADPNGDLRRFLLLAALGLLVALALSWLATKFLLQRWTSAVVDSARRFGAGDLTARAPVPHGLGELTDVAHALNAAAEDIEYRQAEQARLLSELVAAEEETRRRIALDIHDDTAQAVAAAGLRMDALVADLNDPEAREAAANVRRSLAEANRRLRRLLFELRPPALDEAGLATALELFLADSFSDDGFHWRVDNRLDGEPAPEIRAILYRVALEALTNVRKHADAGMVEVLLERRGVGVAVRVRDDGAGFDLPAPNAPPEPGHIGLVSMRERAEAAGGHFSLSSSPGDGTIVDFWMPEPNGDGSRPL
ncbi:MAG TPA: ATP-binding protein [Thermoleophilaceae bacterium]|nr:ATP-binding protein [Thermoleophilaceae bacterium]